MKIHNVFILAFLICFLGFASDSYAADTDKKKVYTIDEARKMISDLPTSGDAIGGEVMQNASEEYYDIRGRQLAYRENARDMRKSLDKRRKIFEKPRMDAMKRHGVLVENVYGAETASYIDKNSENDVIEIVLSEAISGNNIGALPSAAAASIRSSENVGVVEQYILPKGGEVVSVKRKVVTSSDAPYFDPANL